MGLTGSGHRTDPPTRGAPAAPPWRRSACATATLVRRPPPASPAPRPPQKPDRPSLHTPVGRRPASSRTARGRTGRRRRTAPRRTRRGRRTPPDRTGRRVRAPPSRTGRRRIGGVPVAGSRRASSNRSGSPSVKGVPRWSMSAPGARPARQASRSVSATWARHAERQGMRSGRGRGCRGTSSQSAQCPQ